MVYGVVGNLMMHCKEYVFTNNKLDQIPYRDYSYLANHSPFTVSFPQ